MEPIRLRARNRPCVTAEADRNFEEGTLEVEVPERVAVLMAEHPRSFRRTVCWGLAKRRALKRLVLLKDPDGLQCNFAALETKVDMMTAD